MAIRALLIILTEGMCLCSQFYSCVANSNSSVHNQGSGWCALWESNESGLWDRGKPSPPLIELVEERGDIIQSRADDGSRKRVLVPVRAAILIPCYSLNTAVGLRTRI